MDKPKVLGGNEEVEVKFQGLGRGCVEAQKTNDQQNENTPKIQYSLFHHASSLW
jgi:hypothetical protein